MKLTIITLRIAHEDHENRTGEALATELTSVLLDVLGAEIVDDSAVETTVDFPDFSLNLDGGTDAEIERWQERARAELEKFAAAKVEEPARSIAEKP